jgi:hypothetical protein
MSVRLCSILGNPGTTSTAAHVCIIGPKRYFGEAQVVRYGTLLEQHNLVLVLILVLVVSCI